MSPLSNKQALHPTAFVEGSKENAANYHTTSTPFTSLKLKFDSEQDPKP